MSTFPKWIEHVVPQRRGGSGCIAWAYEIMLLAARIPGVDFSTFQDDFDLDKDCSPGEERNNFTTVAEAIGRTYPHVVIKAKLFQPGEGEEKLRLVEEHVRSITYPIVVSDFRRCEQSRALFHAMPVVGQTENSLLLLSGVECDGTLRIQVMSKSEFVRKHDEEWTAGRDVAFLDM